MNKVPTFYFLRPSIYWGLVLGFLTGIPYLVFLWPYGPFGIIFNAVIGIMLGILNGILFQLLLSRFLNIRNYRIIFLFTSFLITFLFSQIAYFISFIPYGGSRSGIFAIAIFPSVINAIIAGYAIQRAAKLYKSGEAKTSSAE